MTTTNNNYCSISRTKNNGSCYSRESLLTLINSYNKIHANKIIVKPNSSIKILWSSLNNKMKKYCKNGEEWFWTDIIRIKTKDYEDKIKLKLIEKKELKPSQPTEWVKNPNEWLSNYDIMNVMKQYEENKKKYYKFLGVFPIDFTEKDVNENCMYDEACKINIAKYIKQKKKFIGFIINLDKHDEPGSHWTSIFMIIDPTYKDYGACYCDSVGTKIPNNIKKYFLNIRKQMKVIYPNNHFNLTFSMKQKQRSNTECGMFSQLFQIYMLKTLLKNKTINFRDYVIDQTINDATMKKLRNTLYRPNIKSLKV